jgi:pimeloyl-ACP methyl ester carboxylesterase
MLYTRELPSFTLGYVHQAETNTHQATPVKDWWGEKSAVPFCIVQGLEDRIAPPGNGYALRDQLGQRVRLVDIPHAGHMLLSEKPEAVADAILSFLREQ